MIPQKRRGVNIAYGFQSVTVGSRDPDVAARRQAEMQLRALIEAKKARGTDGEASYSYAGENAQTADKLTLANAKAMLEAGVDPETVRQETGWFKGYDGKWRFEIDDSEMEIIKSGLYIVQAVYKLEDIISHPLLFEAYPELKQMTVEVRDGGFPAKVAGVYDSTSDKILLNRMIYLNNDMIADLLVHELQHKVQRIENFARGSSPTYWERKGISEEEYNRFVTATEKELAKRLNNLPPQEADKFREYTRLDKKIGELYSKLDFKALMEGADENNTLATLSELEKTHDQLYKELYNNDAFDVINDLLHATEISENLNTVFYKRTAGEIEARDVTGRRSLTAEQRKNTRPDNDRSDVVFAEGGNEGLSYIGDTSDGRRCYKSGFEESVDMDKRKQIFKDWISMIFNLARLS